MNRKSRSPIGIAVILVMATSVSACEIEHKIRRWVSDPGDRKNPRAEKTDEPIDSRLRVAEPNDDVRSAASFRLDSELRPIEGELAADDLVDWISVEIDGEGLHELVVEPEEGLDVSIHVTVGEETISQNEQKAGDRERVRNVTAPIRFAVKTESGEGKYYVRFKRSADSGNIEREPNDLGAQATEWKTPSEIRGYADRSDDRDAFKVVSAVEGQIIALEFRGVPGAMHVVRFFDSESLKTPINSYTVEPNTRLVIPAISTTEPLWVVVSTPGSDHAGRYVLKSITHPENAESIETEPNDQRAVVLEEGKPMMGYFERPEDVDRFALKLVEGPTEALDVIEGFKDKSKIAPTVRVEVEPLFDGLWVGGTVKDKTNKGSSHGEKFSLCGLAADAEFSVHPIEIKSDRPGFDYKIVWSRSGDREPNDDIENAESLMSEGKGVVSVGDVDMYGFQTDGGTTMVEVVGDAEVFFQLFDDQMGVIARSEPAVKTNVSVDLPSGVYYALVQSSKPDANCVGYTIGLKKN